MISRLTEQNKQLAQRVALLADRLETARAGALRDVNDALAVVVVTHNSAGELAALADVAGRSAARPTTSSSSSTTPPRTGPWRWRGRVAERAVVIEAGAERGFAAGLPARRRRRRARRSSVLLNPTRVVAAGALARLRAVAAEQPDWAAWQPVVMLPDGRINTAGGVVHYLGDRLGRALRRATRPTLAGRPVRGRRSPPGPRWSSGARSGSELDGLRDDYFLYGEDLDLGLRLWLAGRRVGVEPRARVIHDYEFDKGARKWYLLERNRWRTVLATYPLALLAAVAPALLATELGLLVVAARGGWLGAEAARAGRDGGRAAARAGAPPRRPAQRGGSARPSSPRSSRARFDSPNLAAPAALRGLAPTGGRGCTARLSSAAAARARIALPVARRMSMILSWVAVPARARGARARLGRARRMGRRRRASSAR